jgi:nitronate monooxygenase
MKRVDDFRLQLGKHELVPIMIGGMGVDISTADLALEASRLGGVGHISDAMINTVTDRRYKTKYVKEKLALYKSSVASEDKSAVKFDLATVEEATRLHVAGTMERKKGSGMIFVNCMEKLTMNAPKETLRVRMRAALDAGIDGITLAAGLHLGSVMPNSASLFPRCVRYRFLSRKMHVRIVCLITSWLKARWLVATWVLAWIGCSTIWLPSLPR